MRDGWQDLKVAMRRLRRAPGFALTAVVTLTVAIAANLVIFGLLNTAVQRQLGIAGADSVWQVVHKPTGYTSQSYPDYLDYKVRNATFSAMAAERIGEAALSTGGQAKKAWDYEVSGNYFEMLGVQPEVGRFFHAADEHGPNSAPYIVLSDGYWRSRFGADPRVVGTTVEVNRHPFTILGVAPESFHGTELFMWPDFWVPMVNEQQIDDWDYLDQRYNHTLFVFGRLRPGVTPQQAAENLNAISSRLAKQYPQTDDELDARLVRPGMLGDQLGDATREFLSGMLLLALLVLVAACLNLAGIFAARAADRARELAVRIAIGSSRWRVLRQVLAEAALLAVAGGAAGAFAATWLLKALSVWRPIAEYPIHVTVTADARVWWLAALLATASGILPALLTARQIWNTDTMQAMRGSAQATIHPGTSHGSVWRTLVPFRLTVRDLLLGGQVAVCALLVTCALVGLRGMQRALRAELGFNPQGVTLAGMEMKMAGYSDRTAFPVQKRMIEQAERVPGVTAVGTVDEPPLNGGGSTTLFYREGVSDFRSSNAAGTAKYFIVSPGYVEAARTQLLAGRDFSWSDDAHHPHVALINQAMARVLFGRGPALGRQFSEPGPTIYTVIGVVENGKYDTLTENPQPAMYWPLMQDNENDVTLVVRSRRPPAEMAPALNAMIAKIDPNLTVTIESWPDQLQLALFPARVATMALGVLGLLAGLLAATGIFGMATYTVAQRLRELGIRVALGAQRRQVLRAAMGRTVLLLGMGSVSGLGLGVLGSRVLASIVYEATVYDPVVLAGATAAMIAIGALAALGPARRAMMADPAALLREQ